MNSFFYVSLLSLLVFKSPFQRDTIQPSQFSNVSSKPIYISDWENNITWNATSTVDQNIYVSKRDIPQLTQEVLNNGVILVFTKGYNFTEANLVEKPIQMPFYFFPTNGNVSGACKWLIAKAPGEIELGINLPEEIKPSFQQSQKNVQLRYFIIDEAFLKQKKLSQNAVQRMSYQQLVNLVNVAP